MARVKHRDANALLRLPTAELLNEVEEHLGDRAYTNWHGLADAMAARAREESDRSEAMRIGRAATRIYGQLAGSARSGLDSLRDSRVMLEAFLATIAEGDARDELVGAVRNHVDHAHKEYLTNKDMLSARRFKNALRAVDILDRARALPFDDELIVLRGLRSHLP